MSKEKVKHRIKNLTGGYVLIMEDGSVKFDLYPNESNNQKEHNDHERTKDK